MTTSLDQALVYCREQLELAREGSKRHAFLVRRIADLEVRQAIGPLQVRAPYVAHVMAEKTDHLLDVAKMRDLVIRPEFIKFDINLEPMMDGMPFGQWLDAMTMD